MEKRMIGRVHRTDECILNPHALSKASRIRKKKPITLIALGANEPKLSGRPGGVVYTLMPIVSLITPSFLRRANEAYWSSQVVWPTSIITCKPDLYSHVVSVVSACVVSPARTPAGENVSGFHPVNNERIDVVDAWNIISTCLPCKSTP